MFARSKNGCNNRVLETSFRFSGHETFPCRFAWLPKAARAVAESPTIFCNDSEDKAIVALGIGKNMVRATRFWAEVSGIISPHEEKGHVVTDFGTKLLLENKRKRPLDPYLEDQQTLWLLHWQIATFRPDPLFAWYFLLNNWQNPELSRDVVTRAFRQEANRLGRDLSDVTLNQHWEVFLHTYVPTRGTKGDVLEDSLDSPFTGLELIVKEGIRESRDRAGKAEPVYSYRREPKPEIGNSLFAWCVSDFWFKRHSHESTLSFSEVAVGMNSPGQIFKLPDEDIRARLECIEKTTNGFFRFEDSAATPRLVREEAEAGYALEQVYAS